MAQVCVYVCASGWADLSSNMDYQWHCWKGSGIRGWFAGYCAPAWTVRLHHGLRLPSSTAQWAIGWQPNLIPSPYPFSPCPHLYSWRIPFPSGYLLLKGAVPPTHPALTLSYPDSRWRRVQLHSSEKKQGPKWRPSPLCTFFALPLMLYGSLPLLRMGLLQSTSGSPMSARVARAVFWILLKNNKTLWSSLSPLFRGKTPHCLFSGEGHRLRLPHNTIQYNKFLVIWFFPVGFAYCLIS